MITTNVAFDTAIDILNKTVIKDFGYDIDGYDRTTIIPVINKLREEKIGYGYGCTKFVVIPDGEESVLKIPFAGCYEWMEVDKESLFHEFNGAPQVEAQDRWNYCESEVAIYKKATAAGLGDFFAHTEFYCKLDNGLPVYLQERVETYNDVYFTYDDIWEEVKTHTLSKKTTDTVKSLREETAWWKMSFEWLCAAVEWYGEEKVRRFIEFMTKDIPELNDDLHEDNYGFAWDGRPVLLDFSGFFR